jgi:chromate transporter
MQTGLTGQVPLAALLFQLGIAFAKAGMFTFGSGYAMLALLEKEIVEAHGWLNPGQFADLVAIAEVTPGPITVNMATFVGFRIAGYPGAVVATFGLVMGPMITMLVIAHFYGLFRTHPVVDAAFRGLRPVVIGLIAFAVLRLSRTSVTDVKGVFIVAATLAGLQYLRASPIVLAFFGIAAGILLYR